MIGRCNDRITKSFERQKTISSSNILSECVIMEQIANGDFHLCYSWNKYRGVKMSELLFMLMIILKEGMELLALKRNHLKVKSIRVMLVMTDFAFNVARNFIRVASAFANVISRKPDL